MAGLAVAAAAGCWLSGAAVAQDRTWVGPASGDWFAAANWSPSDACPQAGESIAVTGGVVLLSNDTASLSALAISNSVLICSNWSTTIRAEAVTIRTNGVITLPPAFPAGAMSNRIRLVCADLTVLPGGRIDADYRGYAGVVNAHGVGPGRGLAISGGAGHGGRGGNPDRQFAATTDNGGGHYDLADEPAQPGSSGGGQANSGEGGAGGGAVRIEASGSVVVDGTITANGKAGNPWAGSMRSGGGSGGSVWITCATLSGGGGISANGGSGLAYSRTPEGGGGGGGRIALVYGAAPAAGGLRVSADAGLGYYPFNTAREGFAIQVPAEAGTIWLPDSSLLGPIVSRLSGRLIVGGSSAWSTSSLLVSNVTFGLADGADINVGGDIVVTGTNGVLMSDGHGAVACGGRVSLEQGGRLALMGDLTCAGGIRVAHSNSYVGLRGNVSVNCGADLVLTNGGSAYFFSGPTNGVWTNGGLWVGVTGAVVICSNAWVYPCSHVSNGGSCVFSVGSLSVAPGGGFNADARGYGGVYSGSGYGPGRGLYSGGGAGHGGKGGATSWGANRDGRPYGSARLPADPGSGGGSHANAPWCPFGGGLIRIDAVRGVALDGTLTASGQDGYYAPTDMRTGCGAGGAIVVRCSRFQGAGVLRANGGTGAGFSSSSGGGGGGGRIAVWAGIPATRYGDAISNASVTDIVITNVCRSFTGLVSATNGVGYTNRPPDGAEPGSVVFVLYTPPPGLLIAVR